MCLIKLMLKLSDNCTYICTCKLKQSLNVPHPKGIKDLGRVVAIEWERQVLSSVHGGLVT